MKMSHLSLLFPAIVVSLFLAGCGASPQEKADLASVQKSSVPSATYDKMVHGDDLSISLGTTVVIARIYDDNDLTAADELVTRPDFEQMLLDLKNGVIQGFLYNSSGSFVSLGATQSGVITWNGQQYTLTGADSSFSYSGAGLGGPYPTSGTFTFSFAPS